MKKQSPFRYIALALLGWLFIAGYFWLLNRANFIALLKPPRLLNQIQAGAEKEFQSSALGQYSLRRQQKAEIDENLFPFVQRYGRHRNSKFLPAVGTITVAWNGKAEVNGEKRPAAYELHYGFDGKPKGFSKVLPALPDSTNLEINEAIVHARLFLRSRNVDTDSLKISQKTSKIENGIQTHDLTFTKPFAYCDSLDERYEITLAASVVTDFTASISLNNEKYRIEKFEDVSDTVLQVAVAVTWMIVIIIMLAVFFRRVKQGEIEFTRAAWIGIAVALVSSVMIVIGAWPDTLGMILGGILGGLFMGVGALAVYALSESYARDTWPEKLALIDLFFRGRFRVKELGSALLTALFIGGLSAFYVGAAIWAAEALQLGYIAVKNEDFWIFGSWLNWGEGIAEALVESFFIILVFLIFMASFLKAKIRRQALFTVLMAFLLLFGGQFIQFLRPLYLLFILILPLSFLWAHWVNKHDFVTISLGISAAYILLNFYQAVLSPDGFWSLPGIAIALCIIAVTVTGILLLFSKRQAADFENYVPEYVSRIAERERFLRELEIARRIQTQFLPQEDPQFSGLDVAGICKPAMEVGGDYYDFIFDKGNYFSVVVGDVSGKGVSAAFYMTMTKGIIKTLAKKIKEPSRILTELNEVFYENAPRNIFVSVLYGVFDMEKRTLIFARAGHNPLLVRKRKAGDMQLLNPNGLAIGMEKGTLFSRIIEEQSVHIEPGDIFIFYTDGISEAMNTRGEEFGEERLEDLLRRNAHGSAKDILENIRKTVFGFSGSAPQHDDFTLVVVKVD